VSAAGPGAPRVERAIRVAGRTIRFRGEPALVTKALGPVVALEERPSPTPSGPDVVVNVGPAAPTARPRPGTRPEDAVVYEPDPVAPRVRAAGVGVATLERDGSVTIGVDPGAPEGDTTAELVTIPALAERLRRDGAFLLHAAVVAPPDAAGSAFLVPASRGSGKTTLSLSLRRAGWRLLSDDRGWLSGPPERATVDPWPEAPRVGDRSLFLLPPHVRPGLRDERTGKAPVPSLTPPRLAAPVAVAGVCLPRLVDGPGGRVARVAGAAALAALAREAVVATAPETAAAALRFVAALLARVPAYEVEVGDDPRALATALAAALSASRKAT
jgi:hypothetical protein